MRIIFVSLLWYDNRICFTSLFNDGGVALLLFFREMLLFRLRQILYRSSLYGIIA